jgi:DNA adenine methylase
MKSPIRWSGSKRLIAKEIISLFPKEIDIYYECFLGGGSVFCELLDTNIKINKLFLSDINNDLISLWKAIINNPDFIISAYKKLYEEIYSIVDEKDQKIFYYNIRDEFNKYRQPELFMFITRVQTNGLIRYNDKNKFNASFTPTRKNKGIEPDKLKKIIIEFCNKIKNIDITFDCIDYTNIIPNSNDYIYLDPPYSNSHGFYNGIIDYDILWKWMNNLSCKYILSFNGIRGNMFNKYEIPNYLYSEELMLKNNKNGFRSISGKKNEDLFEYIYIK